MKTYTLEIFLGDEVAYHEKAEKLGFDDVRQVISILDECKLKLLMSVISHGKNVPAESKPKEV